MEQSYSEFKSQQSLRHRWLDVFEHFGLDMTDQSALAQAIDYLMEGESSSDFIETYARGYAEFAERYAATLTQRLCNEHHEHQQCDLCDQ